MDAVCTWYCTMGAVVPVAALWTLFVSGTVSVTWAVITITSHSNVCLSKGVTIFIAAKNFCDVLCSLELHAACVCSD